MSFFKKLFGLGGGGGEGSAASAPAKTQEHKGFVIAATPYKEQGQFQLCGVISKEVGGVTKEHRFVRADRFSDMETAVEMTFAKGRQVIDERSERIFD